MEILEQLLEILKQTPTMAIWALSIFFTFTLLKLASWVYALKVVFQQAIKRYFDFREAKLKVSLSRIKLDEINSDLENKKTKNDLMSKELLIIKNSQESERIVKRFNKMKINSVSIDSLFELLNAVRSTNYIHQSDIDKSIEILRKHKK